MAEKVTERDKFYYGKGREHATLDILDAIDSFLKYDYPDGKDCGEYGKGVIWGLRQAKKIVNDWGRGENEIRMDEKITVDELTEFLNQFRGDYVVKIIDEKTISSVDELGRKRTGGAMFIDGKILVVEKENQNG